MYRSRLIVVALAGSAEVRGLSARFLRVDPTLCVGHGLCAELFPERVRLDDWGFPMIAPDEVPTWLHRAARRAQASCPALALKFDRTPPRRPIGAGQPHAGRRS
ncbi:MAG TPA: ferredoxin [Candidatus Dormibacteraeota bacterium]|nr:ferredoxin [Candidatus Dormibacteraeota bacterium]